MSCRLKHSWVPGKVPEVRRREHRHQSLAGGGRYLSTLCSVEEVVVNKTVLSPESEQNEPQERRKKKDSQESPPCPQLSSLSLSTQRQHQKRPWQPSMYCRTGIFWERMKALLCPSHFPMPPHSPSPLKLLPEKGSPRMGSWILSRKELKASRRVQWEETVY